MGADFGITYGKFIKITEEDISSTEDNFCPKCGNKIENNVNVIHLNLQNHNDVNKFFNNFDINVEIVENDSGDILIEASTVTSFDTCLISNDEIEEAANENESMDFEKIIETLDENNISYEIIKGVITYCSY